MSKVYLCGHTGSVNRGCEAILRSTTGLLRQHAAGEVGIMTQDLAYDRRLGLDRIAALIPYLDRPFHIKVMSVLRRKLLRDGVWAGRWLNRSLFDRVKPGDILFNVGGDTYCYGTPNLSYAMNDMARERGIPTVFWGCSVDERVLSDPRMREDIGKYSYIVARETISYERLRQAAADPDRVLLACDPAFWLEAEQTHLPVGFLPGNTVGINISPLVLKDCTDDENIMCANVYQLIDHILNETDMHVCLIPHVYDPEHNSQDIRVLRHLYRCYAGDPRVSLVEETLSCTQLKYIISNCRFFIGARTHTVIAAYSSAVPALAISYSVKSIGLARDLLGSEADYAVEWKKISDPLELWNRLCVLMEREAALRDRYARVLPGYRATIHTAIDTIFRSNP